MLDKPVAGSCALEGPRARERRRKGAHARPRLPFCLRRFFQYGAVAIS